MLIVGLTGGIGSGKSTVAGMFEKLGIPVYEADKRARALMNSDVLRDAIRELFGKEAYVNGELNRSYIASIVFENKGMLEKLNAIVHPAVKADHRIWHLQQKSAYTIREAAILFESGAYEDCDKVISVSAPVDLRISRVMERDGVSRDQVLARMDNQWPQEKKDERANFIILNDGHTMLLPQVMKIHEELMKLSGK